MNILVSGTTRNLAEFEKSFMNGFSGGLSNRKNNYVLFPRVLTKEDFQSLPDVVFDLNFDEDIKRFNLYQEQKGVVFFLSSAKICLGSILDVYEGFSCIPFGLNCLPGFIKKKLLEISVPDLRHEEKLNSVASALEFNFQKVKDQAGMVTPRVICMIINEAYFMLEEGTATEADIDKAMKLGTNYPYGPFEWAKVIGVKNVCEILQAVYRETGEERYRVCRGLEGRANYFFK